MTDYQLNPLVENHLLSSLGGGGEGIGLPRPKQQRPGDEATSYLLDNQPAISCGKAMAWTGGSSQHLHDLAEQ